MNDTNVDVKNGTNEVVVRLKNVTKAYEEKAVLSCVSLEIKRGEIVCVLGESGGGKTTLLNLLARIDTPSSGEILWEERDGRLPVVSYAFQEPLLLPNLSALKNLTFVGGEKERCKALLAEANLSYAENRRPFALSGGEKQRVSLLRAFIPPFDLLLADEPFSALDPVAKERMISAFKKRVKEEAGECEVAAVFVTHSVKEAVGLADRIVVIKDGEIVCEERVDRADEEGIQALKTRVAAVLTE